MDIIVLIHQHLVMYASDLKVINTYNWIQPFQNILKMKTHFVY